MTFLTSKRFKTQVYTSESLQFPPAALDTISTPQETTDPVFPSQKIWTAELSRQQWGNGAYEVKSSSNWPGDWGCPLLDCGLMWDMFDNSVSCPCNRMPHFALGHYSIYSGDFLLGASAGYTLDGDYFGEMH